MGCPVVISAPVVFPLLTSLSPWLGCLTSSHEAIAYAWRSTLHLLLEDSFDNRDEHGGTRAVRDSGKVSVANPSGACYPGGHQNEALLAFTSESDCLISSIAHRRAPLKHLTTDGWLKAIPHQTLLQFRVFSLALDVVGTTAASVWGSEAENHLLLMFFSDREA